MLTREFVRSARRAFTTTSRTTRQEIATGGLLASLGLTEASVGGVPLTDPFPGVVDVHRSPPPKDHPKTEVTVLSNGFRVASEDTWGVTAGIGMAVASGSQNETLATTGHSVSPCRTVPLNITAFRVQQEINASGAQVILNSSREQTYYGVECLKTNLPHLLEVVCDTVHNPKFNHWDLDELKAHYLADLENAKKNPQMLLGELLTNAAYQGGLGNPLHGSKLNLDKLTAEALTEHHRQNFRPDRMVLAVAGIDHQDLLKIVEPMAGTLPKAEKYIPPQSAYLGGEIKKPEDDELCHIVIGFDIEGGWEDIKTACATTVLVYLMGGGGSFSSGGPGKGMHSRLYLNVLTRYGWVHNFSVISQAFDKRCLAGVYGAAPPEMAPKLVDVMCEELVSLSKNISDVELNRAKNAAIGQVTSYPSMIDRSLFQILMTLENRSVAAEDMARQVLTYGHRKPAQTFIDGLHAVSKNTLKTLVGNMLKKPLSMASMGNVGYVPRYGEVARRFG